VESLVRGNNLHVTVQRKGGRGSENASTGAGSGKAV